jgi:hypothetical protein
VRWVAQVGGIAQLGEHLLCKQGVIGSIPIVSTTIVCRQTIPSLALPSSGDNRLLANDESRFVCSDGLGSESIGLYRGMSRIRCDHVPGQSVLGCVACRLCGRPVLIGGVIALFFGNVNQVLVRLWARVTRDRSSDGLTVPLFSRLV